MRSESRAHADRRRQRGNGMLVVLLALLAGGIYALVERIDASQLRARRAEATSAALALAREALIAYAVTYRDSHEERSDPAEVFGYLPCPDTAAKGGLFAPGDGTAAGSCGSAGEAAVGLLPYRTLNLPDLRDGEGNCLWYAVAGSFKNSPRSTAPMNWDTQGQFRIRGADGSLFATPDDADGGAVAVIFAPGAALTGQQRSRSEQPCAADPAQIAAYLESVADDFVSGDGRDADGRLVNNDRPAWITARDVFSHIVARKDFANPLGARPEGQLARLADGVRQALDSRLWATMSTLTATSPGTPGDAALPAARAEYAQYAGKRVGDLPDLKPLDIPGRNYDKVVDAWGEQFRYAVCDDLSSISGCFSLGAQSCRGVLLFGGQSRSAVFPFGGPRPAAQKPRAPDRGAALVHYFEAGGGLDLLAGPAMAFTGATSYSNAAPAADVGICLSPGAYATFAKDIGAFVAVADSAAQPAATVDAAAARIVLGNPAATGAGRGCAWFPQPLVFASSLRAYFTLRLADGGEGLVFGIVDAAANSSAIGDGSLCGSNTGSQLGYAGAAVAPPKFGLEIDLRSQTTANCSGGNRNDPDADHLAFVYWGDAASATDDNCHGAGTLGSGTEPQNPRTLTKRSVAVQSATWSDRVVTVASSAAHGLAERQQVAIADVVPGGYNGTYPVSIVDATHFAYSLSGDPGAFVGGGSATTIVGIKNVQASDPHLPHAGALPVDTDIHVRVDAVKSFGSAPTGTKVQAISWAANAATVVTATAHGLADGQSVSIVGVVPAAYNGTHRVAAIDATRFSYALGSDPGAYVDGGTLTPAVALSLKAYVASRLPVSGASYRSTCELSHLRNLAADLSDLCRQNPSIEQANIYIDVDAAAGTALATVYAGFANAQGTSAASRQSVTISNFAIKTQ